MKLNYLLALGAMLSKTPQQIIRVNLTQVLRLIVMCLRDCQQPDTLIAVLGTMETLLKEDPTQLDSHVDNLLDCFLQLVTFTSCMVSKLFRK